MIQMIQMWVCNSTNPLQHLYKRIHCWQSIVMQWGWRPASYLSSTNQLHQIPGFVLVNKSIQQSTGHQEDLSIYIKLSIHLRALLNTRPLQPCDNHVSLQKQNVNEYSSESFLLHIKNTLCASVPRRTSKRGWRFHSSLKAFIQHSSYFVQLNSSFCCNHKYTSPSLLPLKKADMDSH